MVQMYPPLPPDPLRTEVEYRFVVVTTDHNEAQLRKLDRFMEMLGTLHFSESYVQRLDVREFMVKS